MDATSLRSAARAMSRRQFLIRGSKTAIALPISIGALDLILAACTSPSGNTQSALLRVAVPNDTESLDANNTSFLRSSEMCLALYDTLMTTKLTDQGFASAVAAPALASEVVVNDDRTQFDFTLPSGKKFASGNPVTVDDVVWSLQRMADGGLGGFYFGATSVDPANPVEKIDDTHFRISTKAPSNFLEHVLALSNLAIFDSTELKTHATADDPWAKMWATTNAAGGGPYVIESYSAGASTELKSNPNFDRYKVGFDKISFPIVPSAASRVELLQKGDADIALAVPLERLAELESDPEVRVVRAPSLTQHVVRMNNTVGPFVDANLRKAVSHAIPYEQILDSVYYGYAQRLRGPVPAGALAYDDSYPEWTTDLAKAKQFASASGATPLSVDLVYNNAIPELSNAAAIVQQALAEIDITITLKPTAPAQFAELRTNHETPFFMDIQQLFVDDPSYQLQIFKSGVGNNLVNYANADVDAKIDALKAEVDPATRATIAADIQTLIVADAPLVWFAQPDLTYAMRTSITGFWPHASSLIYYGYTSRE